MPSVSKSESIDFDRVPQSGGSWRRNPVTGELTTNPVADSVGSVDSGSGSASEDPITQPDGASPDGMTKE